MVWWFGVIEAQHEIQNPTSAEKIRLLGERLGLDSGAHVLDIASGRGGPARVLAQAFGCRITCVEKAEEFVAVARERTRAAGLERLIDVIHADAQKLPLTPERYDVALCLGASFVWGGLEETIAHLRALVHADGCVVVGEPYWRAWPLPDGFDPDEGEDFTTLAQTAARFEAGGLELTAAIVSSEDDWDRYETLHWSTLDEWLTAHPDHPDAQALRDRGRRQKARYLRWQRDLLGWVILVGRR